MFDLGPMSDSENRGFKRKPDEVLHPADDPDYAFVRDNKRCREDDIQAKKTMNEARSKVSAKAYDIINRNFTSELHQKETEVEAIDAMLLQVQKSLHMVRYAAVSNMFSGPQITRSSGQEASIHPSTRRLLQGKRPRVASSTETSSSTSSLTSLKPTSSVDTTLINAKAIKLENNDTSIIPSYVSPKSDEVKFEPRGLQYKCKRRIIVGNVSRWIECDQREDLSTHKWMLYVRGSKEEPDLSDVIAKVRFLIHQSYHPNNLIEVHRPPFHLTRRGWGEFPARIQIHFKNPLDKPIDVVHNIKLDKTYTGLQTLGAETVVDVWLHQQNVDQKKTTAVAADDISKTFPVIKSEHITTEATTPVKSTSEQCKTKVKAEIKVEPIESVDINKFVSTPKEQFVDQDVQTTFIRCKDKEGGSFFLPVTVLPKNCQKRVDWNRTAITPLKPQRQPPDQLRPQGEQIISVGQLTSGLQQQQQQRKLNQFPLTAQENGTHHLSEGSLSTNSLLKASSLPAGTSLLRSKVFSTPPGTPPSLSRPTTPSTTPTTTPKKFVKCENSSISWKSILAGRQTLSMEEFEKKISRIDPSFHHKRLDYIYLLRQKLLSLDRADFLDDETFLMKIFRYFPLVSALSKESSIYRLLLPFTARTESELNSWSLTKLKASEWMRAKTVQRIMAILKGPQRTTKQLLTLFREFGFSHFTRGTGLPSLEAKSTSPEIDFSAFSTLSRFTQGSQRSHRGHENSFGNSTDKDSLDTSEIVVVDDDVAEELTKVKREPRDTNKLNELESRCGKIGRLILADDNLDAQAYIEHSVAELGIQTEVEEVHPGVFYPLAQKLLFVACKSFCEELIRRGHSESFRDGNLHNANVDLVHLVRGIVNNKRMSFLTNQGLADQEDPVESSSAKNL